MEKRQRRSLSPAFPDLSAISLSRHSRAGNARRSLMTERSERMSEEASYHLTVQSIAVTLESHTTPATGRTSLNPHSTLTY